MLLVMSSLRHIRTNIFRLKQAEFAVVCQVDQSTVSKWESGDLEPSLSQMRRIRDMAKKRRMKWSDKWFFEKPKAA